MTSRRTRSGRNSGVKLQRLLADSPPRPAHTFAAQDASEDPDVEPVVIDDENLAALQDRRKRRDGGGWGGDGAQRRNVWSHAAPRQGRSSIRHQIAPWHRGRPHASLNRNMLMFSLAWVAASDLFVGTIWSKIIRLFLRIRGRRPSGQGRRPDFRQRARRLPGAGSHEPRRLRDPGEVEPGRDRRRNHDPGETQLRVHRPRRHPRHRLREQTTMCFTPTRFSSAIC